MILKAYRRIVNWGNETIRIPGWVIFGLLVFVLPFVVIYIAWTEPICQIEDQAQCLINVPNVRIYLTITAFGFPSIIGILYLKFRSQYMRMSDDNITERESR